MYKKRDKKGQVWIETVLYTLIGLALIGLVLAFVTPKINESKDRALVEQTIDSLSSLDDKITEVANSQGNKRIVDFTIKRGALYVNASGDSLTFEIDKLTKPYSEAGVPIDMGRVQIITLKDQTQSRVYVTLGYSGKYDITYTGGSETKKLTAAATSYRLAITNKGIIGGRKQIDIEDVSGR
jgi:type II secretory pathway pseudopilin PulG